MKRMNKWIFMIGATCMLSSCGIYSTYKPQTSVPENLYGQMCIRDRYGFADSATPG